MPGVRDTTGREGAPRIGAGRLPSVAITHDFLEVYGGAERVTAEIAAAFPDAPVYALLGRRSVAREMGIEDRFHSIITSRERLLRGYRALTPIFPRVADHTRLPDADVVISSSYAFAHRLRTANDAPRVCYCHSPLRFAWTMTDRYRGAWAPGRLSGRAFDAFARALRESDRRSSSEVGLYLTQGPYTADQIDRFYGRQARVIGAPVDCEQFQPGASEPEDWFLFCGRLIEPYSRASLLIDAFRDLPHKLLVVGDGPARQDLEAAAPPNVEFRGRVSDEELVSLMQRCSAALSPTLHDFGLIPVEVMACGRPVIAYGAGGALTTVIPGITGEFFHEQTPEAIAEAIRAFRPEGYQAPLIRAHAERWDRAAFRERLVAAVEDAAATREAKATDPERKPMFTASAASAPRADRLAVPA